MKTFLGSTLAAFLAALLLFTPLANRALAQASTNAAPADPVAVISGATAQLNASTTLINNGLPALKAIQATNAALTTQNANLQATNAAQSTQIAAMQQTNAATQSAMAALAAATTNNATAVSNAGH